MSSLLLNNALNSIQLRRQHQGNQTASSSSSSSRKSIKTSMAKTNARAMIESNNFVQNHHNRHRQSQKTINNHSMNTMNIINDEKKTRTRTAQTRMKSESSTSQSSTTTATNTTTSAQEPPESYVKLSSLTALPRGDRKKIEALGKSVLLFWYRDSICAIESRSPSEGAYSEGFERARLTQDACIECPTTKTTFDLKTGEIKQWYPDNPVLAKLTPQETCRAMEVFPVFVSEKEDAIYVGVKDGSLGPGFVSQSFKGGSDTSLENNNVFGIEPRMYTEDGQELETTSQNGQAKLDPGTVAISIAGVAALAVGGSATCLYFENFVALGIFWIVGFVAAAKVALDVTGVDITELTGGKD